MTPYQPPIVEPPDWEERFRLMFERHEAFLLKLCTLLGLDYMTSGENDVLQKLEQEINNAKSI